MVYFKKEIQILKFWISFVNLLKKRNGNLGTQVVMNTVLFYQQETQAKIALWKAEAKTSL